MIRNGSSLMKPARKHSGFTFVEMTLALGIMATLIVAMGVMAQLVFDGEHYNEAYARVVQHARVALERIEGNVRQATSNPEYPGALVIEQTIGSWTFPDTLVVWRPETTAADPDGAPQIGELVIYSYHPGAPNELWEITDRGNTRTAPAAADAAAWQTLVESLKTSSTSKKVVLTNRLRTATVDEIGENDARYRRGCVRFEQQMNPTAANWASYQAGTRAWEDLDWTQTIYGPDSGLRQSRVRVELQMTPISSVTEMPSDDLPPVAFFGAASLYYPLPR